MDRKKIIEGVRLTLEGIGDNPDREGLVRTPERLAEFYAEAFSGLSQTVDELDFRYYHVVNQEEMIVVKDITFYSLCEHHLLPFFGKAHICYIPRNQRTTGFSTLTRVVDVLARRPQIQERLTSEIADFLEKKLKPLASLVVLEAEHLCMTMRGVKKPGSKTITSAIRGGMRREATRAEAFALIKG
ncbi:MAG: GTP cyclohydrolase I FolE [Candidatus Zixiibacteriota bacterium]